MNPKQVLKPFFQLNMKEKTFTHKWCVYVVVPQEKIYYHWQYEEYAGDGNSPSGVSYKNQYSRLSRYKDEQEVVVYTKNKGDDLIIGVMDNGIGINNADQKKIFDKLYRVPTGNVHDVKGFGLGLSYVKAILYKHQADIKVDSKLGKGTTFEIKLINNTLNA